MSIPVSVWFSMTLHIPELHLQLYTGLGCSSPILSTIHMHAHTHTRSPQTCGASLGRINPKMLSSDLKHDCRLFGQCCFPLWRMWYLKILQKREVKGLTLLSHILVVMILRMAARKLSDSSFSSPFQWSDSPVWDMITELREAFTGHCQSFLPLSFSLRYLLRALITVISFSSSSVPPSIPKS